MPKDNRISLTATDPPPAEMSLKELCNHGAWRVRPGVWESQPGKLQVIERVSE